jgi:hypothetical protein
VQEGAKGYQESLQSNSCHPRNDAKKVGTKKHISLITIKGSGFSYVFFAGWDYIPLYIILYIHIMSQYIPLYIHIYHYIFHYISLLLYIYILLPLYIIISIIYISHISLLFHHIFHMMFLFYTYYVPLKHY